MMNRYLKSLAVMSVLWLTAPIVDASAQTPGFTAQQKTELDGLIRDFILRNPDVIVEALTAYQLRQEEAEKQTTEQNLVRLRESIENNPDDPVMGNANGDVTIVEFFDYQCGYCKRMMKPLVALLKADPKIRFVLKEFPVLGEASVFAARASLAAKMQGKYEPFHLALMGYSGRLNERAVIQAAREVGMNLKQIQKDMNSPKVKAIINANRELAQALGVRGTPAFLIGGDLIPGAVPIESLKELVAKLRAKG
jgi:protein-disulfide isomerase